MRRRGRSRGSCALLAGALAFAACKPGGAGARHAATEHPLVGASAPVLDVPTPDGQSAVRLADHGGKVVVVDFWATWCEPCRQSFPAYQKLFEGAGGKLAVLGVSVDEDPAPIAAFVRETGVNFLIGWDQGQTAAESYAPPTMPTSFVIDKYGVVRFVHAGYSPGDEATLRHEIESLY
jgi:peroxiredoxin